MHLHLLRVWCDFAALEEKPSSEIALFKSLVRPCGAGGGIILSQVLSSTAPAHKIKALGLLPRIPDLANSADPDETVAATAARTPPSTRAGGQDDVS